jgi:hypothetical protein
MKNLSYLKNLDKEDLLALLGLETRRVPVEQWIGFLTIGLVVGAGLTLFLGKKSGKEILADIKARRASRSGPQPTQASAIS